jgi:hypothetical protein
MNQIDAAERSCCASEKAPNFGDWAVLPTDTERAPSRAHDLRDHAGWLAAALADSNSPISIVEAFFQAISAHKNGQKSEIGTVPLRKAFGCS